MVRQLVCTRQSDICAEVVASIFRYQPLAKRIAEINGINQNGGGGYTFIHDGRYGPSQEQQNRHPRWSVDCTIESGGNKRNICLISFITRWAYYRHCRCPSGGDPFGKLAQFLRAMFTDTKRLCTTKTLFTWILNWGGYPTDPQRPINVVHNDRRAVVFGIGRPASQSASHTKCSISKNGDFDFGTSDHRK